MLGVDVGMRRNGGRTFVLGALQNHEKEIVCQIKENVRRFGGGCGGAMIACPFRVFAVRAKATER
jgi:hypothetical protein